MSDLSDALAKPPVPTVDKRVPKGFTPRREVSDKDATIVTEAQPRGAQQADHRQVIVDAGLDPDQWTVTGFRTSDWQSANGTWLEASRLSLAPVEGAVSAGVDMDELLVAAGRNPGVLHDKAPAAGVFVYATADWQLGKHPDGDPGATVQRVKDALEQGLVRYNLVGARAPIHLAFLGDELEGFNSQGGANAWRTSLTLTEQLRLVRRLMLAHVEAFARVAPEVTVVAVASNHGQAVRFGGKGTTRFDDDFCVESLIAVADACATNPTAFGHVKFYTPAEDEMTVTCKVGGTVIAHAHGHQWPKGKHWEWLDAHAGNRRPEGQADVLLAAHHHHLHIQERGPRTFVQVPAQESGSQWWTNQTGQGGHPGALTFTTKDGAMNDVQAIR